MTGAPGCGSTVVLGAFVDAAEGACLRTSFCTHTDPRAFRDLLGTRTTPQALFIDDVHRPGLGTAPHSTLLELLTSALSHRKIWWTSVPRPNLKPLQTPHPPCLYPHQYPIRTRSDILIPLDLTSDAARQPPAPFTNDVPFFGL